ncbi:hypothetical protein D9M68_542650 [compost metagenome]
MDKLILNITKDVSHCILSHGTVTTYIAGARLHIQLNGGNACTILTTIVLLFHQQVQFIKSVKCCTVFFLVI